MAKAAADRRAAGRPEVLIVDDVITAGTAIREALGLIQAGGGRVAGIVVALDRQEVLGEGAEAGSGAAFGCAIGGGGDGSARDCGRKPARPACFRRRKR